MSKASTILRQYIWIVSTIIRARRISFAELNDHWQRTDFSQGVPLSRTTFNRHRDAVEDLFGITIDCDSDNKYHIVNNSVLRNDSVQQWMLNTLTVSNIVGEARGLHDRILLEDIPIEGELLSQVIDAMKRNTRLTVRYRRYGHIKDTEWIVEPYCIKLFRRRWYLLCHTTKRFMVLSFDRITQLELSDEHFNPDPAFNAEAFFSEYFGVMASDQIPLQRIVIRAYGNERFALRDLPLHSSQRLLEESDDHVDFELHLRPTSDFLAHLLSRGRWVEVISPDDIRQEINKLHQEAIK